MKKFITGLAACAVALILCSTIVACGDDSSENSVAFVEESVTLDNRQTQELNYSVCPEGSEVKFEISDETVVKYENNTLTALTTGKATVKIILGSDESVYDECEVTVNAPTGFTAYVDGDYKMVYPSDWSKISQSGMLMFISQTGDNINVVSESKTDVYYNMTADDLVDSLNSSFSQLGYTAEFNSAIRAEERLFGYTRIIFSLDYTLSGVATFQDMIIFDSGDKTYVCTLTFTEEYDGQLASVIAAELVALKN